MLAIGHTRVVAPLGIERIYGDSKCTYGWPRERAFTYIRTWRGWAYLATVIDLASRRVVGWALANTCAPSTRSWATRAMVIQANDLPRTAQPPPSHQPN